MVTLNSASTWTSSSPFTTHHYIRQLPPTTISDSYHPPPYQTATTHHHIRQLPPTTMYQTATTHHYIRQLPPTTISDSYHPPLCTRQLPPIYNTIHKEVENIISVHTVVDIGHFHTRLPQNCNMYCKINAKPKSKESFLPIQLNQYIMSVCMCVCVSLRN